MGFGPIRPRLFLEKNTKNFCPKYVPLDDLCELYIGEIPTDVLFESYIPYKFMKLRMCAM